MYFMGKKFFIFKVFTSKKAFGTDYYCIDNNYDDLNPMNGTCFWTGTTPVSIFQSLFCVFISLTANYNTYSLLHVHSYIFF